MLSSNNADKKVRRSNTATLSDPTFPPAQGHHKYLNKLNIQILIYSSIQRILEAGIPLALIFKYSITDDITHVNVKGFH